MRCISPTPQNLTERSNARRPSCYTLCMTRIALSCLATLVLATLVTVPVWAAEPAAGPTRTASKDHLPLDTTFLRQYAETRGFLLGRPVKPKFTPDGQHVLFLRAAGPKTPKLSLFTFDTATGTTRELLSPESLLNGAEENLSPEEKARRERQRVSVGGFADYHLSPDGSQVLVMLSGQLYLFDRTTAKARVLATGDGTLIDPRWSPDGKKIGFVKNQDVWVFDLAADKAHAVTTGGTPTVTHGLAEFVAQEEMGRFRGYWWSPDAKRIAYTEVDHSGVESWWIADPLRPDRAPQQQFYPRPGKANVRVKLGVVPVAGGETTWVSWNREKYEYLARVDWGEAGLVLGIQSRDQATGQLVRYSSQTLLPEYTHHDQSEPSLPWRNLLAGLPKSTMFRGSPLLLSVREEGDNAASPAHAGAGNFTLSATRFTADVPTALSPVVRFHNFLQYDAQSATVAFIGSDDPTQSHVGVATLTDPASPPDSARELRSARWLTTEPGLHTASVSVTKTGRWAAITSTTPQHMPITVVRSWEKEAPALGTLPSVAAEPPFTPHVTIEKVSDFWTAIIRPRNFDPSKQYPVIVDVYGGPHHLHVQRAMRNWLVPQWLADQGFIVIAIDNRGTPGRGRDWERAIYQKFGTVPLDDQVKGLQALVKKHPEMDPARVGIVGWSFGGYMAANAVLRRPDVFHAAVAGAPVTDWEDYDTHYTERYLGLLPESRKAYDDASLIPLAQNLTRPLLLVHGTADDNVYYRHSLKLADALFRAGRPFESLPLPGITHMYTADPQVTERLWERNVRFFQH
ncbi:MAG: alpha/beta fold hydrolase, partial [Bacteroidales bacterium]|nr:alpha/beta fold hydrolase [Bacteroidales bacterium]